MGVGAAHPVQRLQQGLWLVLSLLLAACAPLPPWTLGAALLFGLALGGAPARLLLCALCAGAVGEAGPAVPFALSLAIGLVAADWFLWGERRVLAGLLGGWLVLGALGATRFPPLQALAQERGLELLLIAGLFSSGPQPPLRPALGLAALLLGLRVAVAVHGDSEDPAVAAARARLGLPALLPGPSGLGPNLRRLGEDPGDHAAALQVLGQDGPARALLAGWRPDGAPLDTADRLRVAAALDAQGRGGEGIRLLRPAIGEPAVAWAWLALRRQNGQPDPDPLPAWAAPPGAPLVPGPLEARFDLTYNRELDWVFAATAPLVRLEIEAAGEPCEGAPHLALTLDDTALSPWSPPSTLGQQAWPLTAAPGPHRLRLRFDNDHHTTTCDRNIRLVAIRLR